MAARRRKQEDELAALQLERDELRDVRGVREAGAEPGAAEGERGAGQGRFSEVVFIPGLNPLKSIRSNQEGSWFGTCRCLFEIRNLTGFRLL